MAENGIQLDPTQRESLLQRLLASEQFSNTSTQRPILELFFCQALDRPISMKEIRAQPFMKYRSFSGPVFRTEIFRIRQNLAEYFGVHRETEPIQAQIPLRRYQLVFVYNTGATLPASALDRFWLPYTIDKSPVSLVLNPLTCFRDSFPKALHETGPFYRPEPDKGVKLKPRAPVYLPTGLMRALLILSNFLGSKGVRCDLDFGEQQIPAESNAISIGSVPDEQLRSRYIEFRSHYHNERRGVIDGNDVADHFEMKDGQPVFICYARLLQLPAGKHAILRIEAYHSIAVEAAAGFLVSSDGIRRLNEKLDASDDARIVFWEGGDDDDYYPSEEPAVDSPSVVDLGIVLEITCGVANLDALKLKPGVPGHLLNIIKTKVREALVPTVPSMIGYDPDAAFDSLKLFDDEGDAPER